MDLTHTCQNESGRVAEDNKQSSHRTANGHIPIPTFNAAKEAKNVRYYSFVGTYYLFLSIYHSARRDSICRSALIKTA